MNRPAHPRFCSSRHGFTLVEMLIIVAIVAVLAAILFPVIATGKARTPAGGGEGLVKIARLSNALLMYAEDFNQTYVSVGAPAQNFAWSPAVNPTVDAAGNPWMGWGLRVSPYEANYQSFLLARDPPTVQFSGDCANAGPVQLTNDFSANWMLGSDGSYGNANNRQDPYAWSPDGTREFNQPTALGAINDPSHTISFLASNAAAPINAETGCLIATLQASDFANDIAPYTFRSEGADVGLADGHAIHVQDDALIAANQGVSGPWSVYHIRSRHLWIEPTMPASSLGYKNTDANGSDLGDL